MRARIRKIKPAKYLQTRRAHRKREISPPGNFPAIQYGTMAMYLPAHTHITTTIHGYIHYHSQAVNPVITAECSPCHLVHAHSSLCH